MTAADKARSDSASWFESVRIWVKEHLGDGTGYLFILPMIILYTMFSVWPIIRGISLAFMDFDWLFVDRAHFNGIANFIELSQDETFWFTLSRTLYFLVLMVPASVLGDPPGARICHRPWATRRPLFLRRVDDLFCDAEGCAHPGRDAG